MCTDDLQKSMEDAGMSAVREFVTLFNCLQEPYCEAVSSVYYIVTY